MDWGGSLECILVCMRDSLRIRGSMASVDIFGMMDITILDIGIKNKDMGMENMSLLIKLFSKASGFMINYKFKKRQQMAQKRQKQVKGNCKSSILKEKRQKKLWRIFQPNIILV
jgi:hypothetical protein